MPKQVEKTEGLCEASGWRDALDVVRQVLPLLLFAFGLLATCLIAWWAFLLFGPRTVGGASWLWFAFIPYLTAWSVMTFRSWRVAAAFGVALPVLMLGPVLVGMFGIFVSILPFFGLPGFALLGTCTGLLLLLAQRRDGPLGSRRWVAVHLCGLGLAGLFLLPGFDAGPHFSDVVLSRLWKPLLIGLSIHAGASWLALRAEGRDRVKPLRVVTLVGATYLGGIFAYAASYPGRSAFAWPWAVKNEPALRATRGEGVFASGEAVEFGISPRTAPYIVPQDWSLSVRGGAGVGGQVWPLRGFNLKRTQSQAEVFASFDVLLLPQPDRFGEPRPPISTHPRAQWRRLRCSEEAPTSEGLTICRPAGGAPEPAEPRPVTVHRFVDVQPPQPGGRAYLVFNAYVRAFYVPAGLCNLTLPLASGGEVRVSVRESDLASWADVRAEIGHVLGGTEGLALGTYERVLPGIPIAD